MAKSHQYDIADAVSAGFVGLVIAVDRFDPDGFSAFQSYASLWIQQNINRECNPIWMEYYFPAHYKEKMLCVYECYLSVLERVPDKPFEGIITEISEYLGISFIQTKDFLKAAIQQSENRLSISDFFEDDFCSEVSALPQGLIQPGEELFDSVIASILEESVLETLSTLTPKEEKVLKLRFGIDDDCPRTLEETGNEFSITRERIRQIEVKALRKLSHPSRAKKLKDFWQ